MAIVFDIIFLSRETGFGQTNLIYGLTRDTSTGAIHFISYDYDVQVYDTLLELPAGTQLDILANAADQYNGKYFFLADMPGYTGNNFFSIDINSLQLKWIAQVGSYLYSYMNASDSDFIADFDYNPFTNAIMYRQNNMLKEVGVDSAFSSIITSLPTNYAGTTGSIRAFNLNAENYFYENFDSVYPILIESYVVIDVENDSIIYHEPIQGRDLESIVYNPNSDTMQYIAIAGAWYDSTYLVDADPFTQSEQYICLQAEQIPSNFFWSTYDSKNDFYINSYLSPNDNSYKLAIYDIPNKVLVKTVPFDNFFVLIQSFHLPPTLLKYRSGKLYTAHGISYNWYFNDSLIAQTFSNVFEPQQSGNYRVVVEYEKGSDTSKTLSVDLENTSINSYPKAKSLKVFPIPASSSITVDFGTLPEEITIELLDLLGRTLYKTEAQASTRNITIDISDNPEGTYFLRVAAGKINETAKIIVAH
jgi:hypothetical protein